jgi:hypothetical protein
MLKIEWQGERDHQPSVIMAAGPFVIGLVRMRPTLFVEIRFTVRILMVCMVMVVVMRVVMVLPHVLSHPYPVDRPYVVIVPHAGVQQRGLHLYGLVLQRIVEIERGEQYEIVQ